MKCNDCDTEIIIPKDIMEGEVISCPNCGLEYQNKKGKLSELTLEGLDYGE